MASSVATPLEKQFSTIAGLDSMTSTSSPGLDRRSRCSSPSTATSTPPRRTCRPRSPRRCASCRRTCRRRRPTRRSTRRTRRSSTSRSRSPTLPLSQLDEYGETMLAQRISMVTGVAQVQVLRLAEVRGAHPARPAGAGRARHRHRRGRDAPCRTANVNLPTGILCGPDRRRTRSRRPASSQRRGVPPAHRRLPQRRAGAAGRTSAHVVDGVREQQGGGWFNDERAIVARRSSGSRARTPSRSRRPCASCCRRFETQLPAVGRAARRSTTARTRSATRSTT